VNATPNFAMVVEVAARRAGDGFARAVLRRFNARSVGVGVLVSCALALVVDLVAIRNAAPTLATVLRPEVLLGKFVACLTIFVATMIADEAVARGARSLPAYAAAVVAGAAFGAFLQWHVTTHVLGPISWSRGPGGLWLIQPATVFTSSLLVGTLAVSVYVNQRTALAAMRRMQVAEQARAAAQRRTLESQLQAMQARIEPGFLFDTLAQVRDLYEVDAVRAGTMLGDLIAYLRAALPHLRRSSSTLGREVELARAFVDIARAGGRGLAFGLTLDAASADAPLPGMLLLPLAQHALQHSSALHIDAGAAGGRIRLVLAVDGPVFAPQAAHATLDALCARLNALYGDAALLSLDALPAGGSRATLELPLRPAGTEGE
jgi:hypothetical protein